MSKKDRSAHGGFMQYRVSDKKFAYPGGSMSMTSWRFHDSE
jgi:hypothetical protein